MKQLQSSFISETQVRYITFALVFIGLTLIPDNAIAQAGGADWTQTGAQNEISKAGKFAYMVLRGFCGIGALYFLAKTIMGVFMRGEGQVLNNLVYFVIAVIVFLLIKPTVQAFFKISLE